MKLPGRESTSKQAFWYSVVKTNTVFTKSSWEIEQDNTEAMKHFAHLGYKTH